MSVLETVEKHAKTYLAQYTTLFDTESNDVSASMQANIMTIAGLADGEWTLSGYTPVGNAASEGMINDTFDFVGGVVDVGDFLETGPTIYSIKARKLKTGIFMNRDLAEEYIINNSGTSIIAIYQGDITGIPKSTGNSNSADMTTKIESIIGVMFSIDTNQLDDSGCVNYDKLFINSVLNSQDREADVNASQLQFLNVATRGLIGQNYVVDMQFNYTDSIFIDEAFEDSIKHFEGTIGDLTVNEE